VVNVTRLCLDLGVTAWIAWLDSDDGPAGQAYRRSGARTAPGRWDKTNKFYIGTISQLSIKWQRNRPTVRGKTKTQVKDRLDALHQEIRAGVALSRLPWLPVLLPV
jgi:hypothetical protein